MVRGRRGGALVVCCGIQGPERRFRVSESARVTPQRGKASRGHHPGANDRPDAAGDPDPPVGFRRWPPSPDGFPIVAKRRLRVPQRGSASGCLDRVISAQIRWSYRVQTGQL